MVMQDHSGEITALKFLDFSVSFGRPPVPPTGVWVDRPTLQKALAQAGIVEAAPYHIQSKSYDANFGNAQLLEELAGAPGLIPTWVAIPSALAMGCSAEMFVARMRENKVGAVRLFPSSESMPAVATRYAFAKWFYHDFLAVLEENGVPVALELSPSRRSEPEWQKLYAVAKEFPRLRLILADGFQRTTWTLVQLMKECPNLYVQTSGLDVHRQLEYLTQQVGAERFLAGSKYPVSAFGTMVGQILFSNLGEREKKLIAGGNARRLMGWNDAKGGAGR